WPRGSSSSTARSSFSPSAAGSTRYSEISSVCSASACRWRSAEGGDMDFGLTEEQRAISELAAKILDDNTEPERIRGVEDGETPGLDKDLWAKLAEASLLGVCIPESDNGLGLGFV